MTTITEIHPWPPACIGISKADRDDYDQSRCSPVYFLEGEWQWCNAGNGSHGHIRYTRGGRAVYDNRAPFCAWCGNIV